MTAPYPQPGAHILPDEKAPPVRSTTRDAVARALWTLKDLDAQLGSEISSMQSDIDRVRTHCALIEEERRVAVALLRNVVSGFDGGDGERVLAAVEAARAMVEGKK